MPMTPDQSRPVSQERRWGIFKTLVRAALIPVIIMPAPVLAGSPLPRGLVYLRDIDPTIVQDMRYAGSHNFVGRPVKGYLGPACILSAPAAHALETVQRRLA